MIGAGLEVADKWEKWKGLNQIDACLVASDGEA